MEKKFVPLFKEQGVVYLDVIAKYENKNIEGIISFSKERLDLIQEEINRTMKEIEKEGNIIFEWGKLEESSRRFCYYFKYGKLL